MAARRLNPTFVPTNSRRASSPISIAMSIMLSQFVDPGLAEPPMSVSLLAQEEPDDEEDEDDDDEDDQESGDDDADSDGYSE